MDQPKLKKPGFSRTPSVLCEHMISTPQENPQYHIHSEFEIFLFLRGDVHYIVEQSVYPLQPGDILVLNSTELHYPSFQSDAEFERIVLHFDPAVIQQLSTVRTPLLHRFLVHPCGKNNLIRLSPHDLQYFYTLALQIVEESHSQQWGDDILSIVHLAEMLVLLENGQQIDLKTESLSPYVQQILHYIEQTLPNPISLADVADALSVDRFHLNKVFKREMGTTVYNYILLKRLNWARSLLIQGCSVGEACSGAGFNDYTNFIRTFKKYTGVTPSAYARLAPYELAALPEDEPPLDEA